MASDEWRAGNGPTGANCRYAMATLTTSRDANLLDEKKWPSRRYKEKEG